MGGQEIDVAKQVNDWVEHNELPVVPKVGALNEYVQLAAAGWLDSKIAEGGLYRHAYPGAFNAHAAGDAVAMLDWLAVLHRRCEARIAPPGCAKVGSKSVKRGRCLFIGGAHQNTGRSAAVWRCQ